MRPPECASRATGPGWRTNVWEAAKRPELPSYCDRLARGYGELARAPADAHATADEADRLWPGRAAPWVLKGRASILLEQYARAADELERARALDPRALEDPFALRAWAIAEQRTGKPEQALGAYRMLAPRLSLVFSPEERAAVLVEAAEVALGMGPAALDHAIAFLEEARVLPLTSLRARVLAELALALDRRGMTLEASSALGAFAQAALDPRALTGTGEIAAAAALVLSQTDPREARTRWDLYLETQAGKGPWADHARRRRDALVPTEKGRAAR
jgi:tetratricopeptide (TPR) repeat protein